MKKSEATVKDYLYCETCKEFVDYWVYDYSLVMAGHEDCNVRIVTEAELQLLKRDCENFECFDSEEDEKAGVLNE